MRFYLASRYGRRDELRGYAEELQALGHEVTSRWLWEGDEGVTDDGGTLRGSDEALHRAAQRDIEDIDRSDGQVFFTEDPQSHFGRGGRHVEFGFALAASRGPMIIVGPRENLFHYLPELEQFDTYGDFANSLA